MTDITQSIRPTTTEERRADALNEIRQLHIEHNLMRAKADADRRTIDRLTDRCEMLEDDLRTTRHNERVITRKLMRLASAMSNMSNLAKDADEIMRSTREWQDDETEEHAKAEQQSAAEAVAKLTHQHDDVAVVTNGDR